MADWNRGHGAVDDMLDAENKLLADNLASKVSRLKSVCVTTDQIISATKSFSITSSPFTLKVVGIIVRASSYYVNVLLFSLLCNSLTFKLAYDIDKEAEEQNSYLDGMDSNFLSATGLLTGSVKRFSGMVRSGKDNRKILCYVSVGLVFVFFLLYYLIYRLQN
uniref:t-SNARE coiled-coil homology domain-containing protein n=1 Tax=Esox lucius TaxID=8010 RepID=A0AAY5KI92_ESOLU